MIMSCKRYLKTPLQQFTVYGYTLFMTMSCIRYLKTPLQQFTVYCYSLYTIPQDTVTTVLCLWLYPVYDTSRHPYNLPPFMAISCIRYLKAPLQPSSVYGYFLYTIPQDTLTTVHCLWLYHVYDTSRHPYNSPLFMAISCIRYLKTPLQQSSVYGYFLYTIPQDILTTVHCLCNSLHTIPQDTLTTVHCLCNSLYTIPQDTLTTVHCLWLFPVYDSSIHPYNSSLFMTMPCICNIKTP